MMKFRITIFCVIALLVFGSTALSIEKQTAPPADTSGNILQEEPIKAETPPDELMPTDGPGKPLEAPPDPERFERLRMRKMLDLLKLDDKQKAAFIAIAGKYRDRRKGSFEAHQATIDSLAFEVKKDNLDQENIKRLIRQLDVLEFRQARLRHDFRQEIRPLLTLEQYAKFVVFEYRFEARVLDRLNEFRRGGRHRSGTGKFPPPGHPITEDDSI